MFTATIIRRAGRGLLCVTVGLLTASCASHPWREDPNVTAGRWEVSPDPATARDTLPPRNDLTYTPDDTPAPEPSMSIRWPSASTQAPSCPEISVSKK